MMAVHSNDELVSEYHLDLASRGRHAMTISGYMYDIRLFRQYLQDNLLQFATMDDILSFLNTSVTLTTRKRRLSALRNFYRYLVESGVVATNPAEHVHNSHPQLAPKKILTWEEQQALMKAAWDIGVVPYLAVGLMLYAGLKRAEVLSFKPSDAQITLTGDTPTIKLFVRAEAVRIVELSRDNHWFNVNLVGILNMAPDSEDTLVKVAPASINYTVARVAKKAGIVGVVSPNTLRDTWAVSRAKNCRNPSELLSQLGLSVDPHNIQRARAYLALANAKWAAPKLPLDM